MTNRKARRERIESTKMWANALGYELSKYCSFCRKDIEGEYSKWRKRFYHPACVTRAKRVDNQMKFSNKNMYGGFR